MQSSATTRHKRSAGLNLLKDSRLLKEFAYVDGTWRASASGRSISVTDPGNGDWIGQIPALTASESAEAIAAAERSFTPWAALLPQERARVLRNWYNEMVAHREDLAVLMTLEQGKPLSEARGEIDYAAAFIEFYAEEAKRANIETVTSHLAGAAMSVQRQPMPHAAASALPRSNCSSSRAWSRPRPGTWPRRPVSPKARSTVTSNPRTIWSGTFSATTTSASAPT